MKIEYIIKDERPVGYKLVPENDEDREKLGVVRDLHFFGHDDTYIRYNGIELTDTDLGKSQDNIKSLKFIQYQHTSEFEFNKMIESPRKSDTKSKLDWTAGFGLRKVFTKKRKFNLLKSLFR